jgi:hypothetical protein
MSTCRLTTLNSSTCRSTTCCSTTCRSTTLHCTGFFPLCFDFSCFSRAKCQGCLQHDSRSTIIDNLYFADESSATRLSRSMWQSPGVDVMITIFGEKIGVFSKKPMLWIFFAWFSFVFSQKRQFFRCIFRRKYLKNHNIGPRTWKKYVVNGRLLRPVF